MLTIFRSNIVVVLRFYNPWSLTSALDSAGMFAYTRSLPRSSALSLVQPSLLPPWESPSIFIIFLLSPHPLLSRFRPGPFPLYSPNIYLRFLVYCTMGLLLITEEYLLLCSLVMPLQNNTILYGIMGSAQYKTSY